MSQTAVIAIGAPGSGKSTYLKKLKNHVYISTDDIREELSGSPLDKTRNDEAWEEVYTRIHASLRVGRNVAIDATNSRPVYRNVLVAHCRQYANCIQGVFFDIPLSVCLSRNLNPERGRVVSEEIIESIAQRISDYPPTMTDGFDEIITIRS